MERKRLSQRKVGDPILELIIEGGHYHHSDGDAVGGTYRYWELSPEKANRMPRPRLWGWVLIRVSTSHIAYWLIAAIAGVDPNKASVASTAWAKYIVDGDLAYEIDAREIPDGWSTGYVPFGRTSPYQGPPQPFFSNGVQQVYQLNAKLVDFAFGLTANVQLPDDSNLQQIRAGYPTYPNALKPPFVLEGDDLAADTFWIADLLNTWAENWVSYWTAGQGFFAIERLRGYRRRPGAPIPLPSGSCRSESVSSTTRRQ